MRLRISVSVLLLAGCLLACRQPESAPQVVTGLPPTLTILYTCDTRGHLEPCACSGGHEGGVARRATSLARQQTGARLLVDAGDVTAGPREWERLELQSLLAAYQVMKYDAVNAGDREASLDVDGLRESGRQCAQLISANLVDTNGLPVLPPYTITRLANGSRAGILGVLDDRAPVANIGRGLRVTPPQDAIARYLPELKQKADILVLLAFMNEEAMKELAARFYEFRVVIGGRVAQASAQPLLVNRSLLVFITDKGKRIGRLDLAFDAAGSCTATNDIITLNDSIPDDPQMEALVEDFRAQQKARGFPTGPRAEDDEGLSLIGIPQPTSQREGQP